MQYTIPALVALAISANAAPALHWDFPTGFGGPIATGVSPTGLVPTGTGMIPFPTASFEKKTVKSVRRADDDGDEDEDEDADEDDESSSSADDETASSTAATSTKSSAKSSGKASSTGATTAIGSSTPATTTAASSSNNSASSGGSLPASSGTSVLSAAQTIAAGESFDGGMVAFDRGVDCSGQSEGGDSDSVFYLEAGASLSNVIIGPNQVEGVHCFGACTLTNVWWSAVCEDAFTIKEQEAGETTTISGGGAFGAEDKVLQHNGGGTLSVDGFTVETFGKLYRSCGNCKTMYERHVILNDVTATDGKSLAGINSNYGDTATFTNIVASGVTDICVEYEGTDDNSAEPEEISSGPSDYCIYSTSDVTSS